MAESGKKQFVSPNAVETLVFEWGTLRCLSSPRITGAERFSTGVVEIEPGKGHQVHSHPGVEEIIYVVSGTGDQSLGEISQNVQPGDLIHVFPGVEHSTINTGTETLVLLVVYSPPGPEEELRAMPDCRIVPPENP